MKYSFKIDEQRFFDKVRSPLFSGRMAQEQVDGINVVLKAFDGLDVRYVGYALATVYHETAKTMQPVNESGKGKGRDYGKKLKMSRKPYTSPDKIYYGRGLVQLTWYENYANMTAAAKKAGKDWDFLNNPELMLQDEPSAWVMRYGMINGSFTGKKLNDYFNDSVTQPINARRIINGTDKAELIAGYYEYFMKALTT